VPAVVFIFGLVTGSLPVKVDLVFLGVRSVEIFGCHFEHLRNGNQEVEEINHFDAGVLFVEFLVLGPPFPRDAVSQLRDFLCHRPAIVQDPLLALFVSHVGGVHADFQIEGLLHLEDFVELVGVSHTGIMREF